MPSTIIRHQVSLPRRGLFEVPDASGLQFTCSEGALWITLDNDDRDIVLERGETFLTAEHRRALVYAFGASVLEVREPAPEPRLTGKVASAGSRPAFA